MQNENSITVEQMEQELLKRRTCEEVFSSHFKLRAEGKVEEDLKLNYHENVVVISNYGNFYGHDGVRQSALILSRLVPTTNYELKDTHVIEKEGAVLELWGSKTSETHVNDGIDTFLIRDGKIVVQTIYYSLIDKKKENQVL